MSETSQQFQTQLRELIHKLRQPLSTIETCTCYLHLVTPEEASRIHAQLDTIEQQVEEANRILIESASQEGRTLSEAEESRSRTNARMAGVTY